MTRAQLAEFVNGEVNRREARQKAEAERARRRAQLESDPLGYADEERERLAVEEAQAAQRERMGQTLAYYDQHTMAPFLSSLPPDIVEQLRQETGGGVEGLEGRERLIAPAGSSWSSASAPTSAARCSPAATGAPPGAPPVEGVTPSAVPCASNNCSGRPSPTRSPSPR